MATRCDRCLQRDVRGLRLTLVLSATLHGSLAGGVNLDSWPAFAGMIDPAHGVWLAGGFAIGAIVGFPVHVFLHELGHLLAARAAKMRVTRFVLGQGPPVLSTTVGSTVVALHRYQGFGSVWADTVDRRRYRRQWATFFLGGPAFSVAAAAIGLAFAERTFLGSAFFAFGLLNMIMAVVTLRPTRGFGGAVSSDMADLLAQRELTDPDVEADIAYRASQRVFAAEKKGDDAAAVATAHRFLEQYPESLEAPWFQQVIADASPDAIS